MNWSSFKFYGLIFTWFFELKSFYLQKFQILSNYSEKKQHIKGGGEWAQIERGKKAKGGGWHWKGGNKWSAYYGFYLSELIEIIIECSSPVNKVFHCDVQIYGPYVGHVLTIAKL